MHDGRWNISSIVAGAIVFAFALFLCCCACCYGRSLCNSLVIQRYSANAAACSAIAGVLAFVGLVVYTNEARLSRGVAERQLESTMMPVVTLDISGETVPGQPLNLNLQFRNVGTGPAFGVTVDRINGTDQASLVIDPVPLIASKQTVPAGFYVSHDGQKSNTVLGLTQLGHDFANGEFADGTTFVIGCSELLSRRSYRFHHVVHCTPNRVWTEFVPPPSAID